MGLFDKKYCDICGEKIGLLGNRKLEDGNLCKDCAKKLSPWFSDRRRSTVADIRAQLAYREENQLRAAQFRVSRSFGESWKVLLDDDRRCFTVTRARELAEANPDILDFDAITGCRMDIDESRTELTREGPDGKDISYVPPRYEYSYDFYLIISVRHPYFDEMRFPLNASSVYYEPQRMPLRAGGPSQAERRRQRRPGKLRRVPPVPPDGRRDLPRARAGAQRRHAGRQRRERSSRRPCKRAGGVDLPRLRRRQHGQILRILRFPPPLTAARTA